VKPFHLSSETVLLIKSNRSTYQVKPFYLSSQTVLPFKRSVRSYSQEAHLAYIAAHDLELRGRIYLNEQGINAQMSGRGFTSVHCKSLNEAVVLSLTRTTTEATTLIPLYEPHTSSEIK
jgi:hypothetical protein